ASGVVKPYPRRHADLFAQVVERGGLLLSEERDCAPHRGRFLKRNRVIAALGEATVVVQAPARSGALSTARHAAKLGRPLLAVPASPWDLRGAGGSHLLTGDARPCFGPEDVLAALERAAEADASEGMEVGDAAPRRAGAGASRRAAGTGRAKVEGRVASPLAAPTRPRRRREGDEGALELLLSSRPRHPDELAAALGWEAGRVQRALLGLLLAGEADERPGGRWVRVRRAR
ncbi:MAG: hypothetical protein CMH59_24705, partial [Myxococcales bacterium]|nr:hypothetical protein [Myxococcales bacterium]